jgi:hypothetical protein
MSEVEWPPGGLGLRSLPRRRLRLLRIRFRARAKRKTTDMAELAQSNRHRRQQTRTPPPVCFTLLRLPSHPWTVSDETRPRIGRFFMFSALTPQDSMPTTCRLAPTRPQTGKLPAEPGSPPDCFSALPDRRRPPPLSERRFFAPSVRVCLSCMPFNPDASTHSIRVSLLPRHSSLRERRRVACASARPLRSVGCRPQSLGRHPRRTAIAASDALAQSEDGHAQARLPSRPGGGSGQANAAGVRPSPVAAEDGVAGFGSGLPSTPASQPLLSRRRRNVAPKVSPTEAAFTSALLCVAIPEAGLSPQSSPGGQGPRNPPTADRRHPVTTFPHAVFALARHNSLRERRRVAHLFTE